LARSGQESLLFSTGSQAKELVTGDALKLVLSLEPKLRAFGFYLKLSKAKHETVEMLISFLLTSRDLMTQIKMAIIRT
jgi:hypothetical protein